MMGTKKIILTGGSGFVGNNLARHFLDRGHDVGLILRKQSQRWRIEDLGDQITRFDIDLMNRSQIKNVVDNFHPDLICHLATYGAYTGRQQNLDLMIDTNIIATRNIIEAAKGIPVLNTGSSSEYGIKGSPMCETDSCFPESNYGRTKLIQTTYCSERGIPTLRISSAYGPWEDPRRLIPVLIRAKIKGLPLKLINSVRDYIFTEDISNAFEAAHENYDRIRGEVINLGSGRQTNVQSILSIIDEIDAKELKIDWDFDQVQKEPEIWVLDITKAKNLLGWSPKVSLEEGLKQTYCWWSNHINGTEK